MTGITTTQSLSPAVAQNFSLKLLSTPTPYLIHSLAATRKKMPAKSGDTLVMRRYHRLKEAIIPLGDSAVAPPPQLLTATDVSAKIEFYGTYVTLSEQVTLHNEDNTLNSAAIRLGACLRETEDILVRNALNSTASFINCVGGSNGDSPTELHRSDIDSVVRALVNANAHTIEEMIEPSTSIATAGVRSAYLAFSSSELIGDLEAISGFQTVNQYSQPQQALTSEWGSCSNLRFLVSSLGSMDTNASATGKNVYNTFCCGMESYAMIEQTGASATFIYRPPLYHSPLGLAASVGFKFAAAQKILNDSWVINLRATLKGG